MQELQKLDIPIIGTTFIHDWNKESIFLAIENITSDKVILKPSISAGGRNVFLLEEKSRYAINTLLEKIPSWEN